MSTVDAKHAVETGMFVAFIATYPNAMGFFGIPLWVFGVVFIGIQVLQLTGARALVLPCGAISHTPLARLEDDLDLVAAEYPDVTTGYDHIDAACIHFVERPERYDVVVTDNLFGDILTDLGGAVAGGVLGGLAGFEVTLRE